LTYHSIPPRIYSKHDYTGAAPRKDQPRPRPASSPRRAATMHPPCMPSCPFAHALPRAEPTDVKRPVCPRYPLHVYSRVWVGVGLL
jgi:hypothetical protein